MTTPTLYVFDIGDSFGGDNSCAYAAAGGSTFLIAGGNSDTNLAMVWDGRDTVTIPVTGAMAYDINNDGVVVGDCKSVADIWNGFRYEYHTESLVTYEAPAFSAYPSGAPVRVSSISHAGLACGEAMYDNGGGLYDYHAVLLHDSGTIEDIEYGSPDASAAVAINSDEDAIVQATSAVTGYSTAFVRDGVTHAWTEIDLPSGEVQLAAVDLNDADQWLVNHGNATPPQNSYLMAGAATLTLAGAVGYALNNRGDVVYTVGGLMYVRYASGVVVSFGFSGFPYDISDNGIIVGKYYNGSAYRAFMAFAVEDTPTGGLYFLSTNDTDNPFVLTGSDARLEKIVPLWPNPYQANSSNDDVLYVVTKRTVGGAAVRYIERLHNRYIGP